MQLRNVVWIRIDALRVLICHGSQATRIFHVLWWCINIFLLLNSLDLLLFLEKLHERALSWHLDYVLLAVIFIDFIADGPAQLLFIFVAVFLEGFEARCLHNDVLITSNSNDLFIDLDGHGAHRTLTVTVVKASEIFKAFAHIDSDVLRV